MNCLFIIGNGFDLAHELNTSYANFRNWLETKYNTTNNYFDQLPKFQTNYKRLECYNRCEMAQLFYALFSNSCNSTWSNFEDALADMDWVRFFRKIAVSSDYYQMQSDIRNIGCKLRDFHHLAKDYFSEWIHSIWLNDAKPIENFNELTASKDMAYLSFNYTNTLEEIYGIKEVCHIHGQSGSHFELIIGHNSDKKIKFKSANPVFSHLLLDAEESINNIISDYKKDTKRQLKHNIGFFNKLSELKQIFSYGYGFWYIDRYYFEHLFSHMDTSNIDFYLHCFTPAERKEMENRIREYGFKGKLYSLDNQFIPHKHYITM